MPVAYISGYKRLVVLLVKPWYNVWNMLNSDNNILNNQLGKIDLNQANAYSNAYYKYPYNHGCDCDFCPCCGKCRGHSYKPYWGDMNPIWCQAGTAGTLSADYSTFQNGTTSGYSVSNEVSEKKETLLDEILKYNSSERGQDWNGPKCAF